MLTRVAIGLAALAITSYSQEPVSFTFPDVDFAEVIGDPLGARAFKFATRLWLYARNKTQLGYNDVSTIAIRPASNGLTATMTPVNARASQILDFLTDTDICIRASGNDFCTTGLEATQEPPDATFAPATTPQTTVDNSSLFYQDRAFMIYAAGGLGGLLLILLMVLCCKRRQRGKDERGMNEFRDRLNTQLSTLDQLLAADSLPSSIH
eukprot:TRINITY_DN27231_c0_g1_i1.p1 TRINITY_DN27231_c0_g1~~TRINITY_DN27231_c0_g1_i1.p1  ORF type:complete len:209 (+),score=32.80 TRINITY_DN27231_c0_g1_i1:83-709(+)